MRKQLKNKRRACALCKPWKRKRSCRWKHKEAAELRQCESLNRVLGQQRS